MKCFITIYIINKPFTEFIKLDMLNQVGQLPVKVRWQDIPLTSRFLDEAFKNNTLTEYNTLTE